MSCEKLAGCPFFNDQLADSPAMTAMLKKKYCQSDGNFRNCARYLVAGKLGSAAVPRDLYPNMCERAREILGL
ncbi:MAG: hypothetical protein N3A57_03715 [Negativicutes bacterium]|nr:hypothetical protein [Negativicutes bacterium]